MHDMYKDLEKYEVKHIYTLSNKLKWWGDGVWVDEPDTVLFKYKGYDCEVERIVSPENPKHTNHMFGGHLCGYIRIPEGHPLFGQVVFDLDDRLDINVHGGLTFGEMIDGEYWIGFDCAHSGDCMPSMEYLKKTDPSLISIRKAFPIPKTMENHALFNPVYRNVDYVIAEIKDAVEQLIAMELTNIIEGHSNVQVGDK